jgi:hypothetical protein
VCRSQLSSDAPKRTVVGLTPGWTETTSTFIGQGVERVVPPSFGTLVDSVTFTGTGAIVSPAAAFAADSPRRDPINGRQWP